MKTVEFLSKFEEFCSQLKSAECTVTAGADIRRNTRIVIDEDGYFILREAESWKRVRTSVNVADVTELRFTDSEYEPAGFFIICADDTGLMIDADEDEIYYYEDGAPSGWGSATEHFRRYPFCPPDEETEEPEDGASDGALPEHAAADDGAE